MMAGRTLCLLCLGLAAFIDKRKKSIPVWIVIAGALAGVILRLTAADTDWRDVLLGLVPGVLMMLISLATRGGVGLGDGLIMLVIGIFEGFWICFISSFAGLLLSGLAALVLLIIKKDNKYTIPFLPFLLMGYTLSLTINL